MIPAPGASSALADIGASRPTREPRETREPRAPREPRATREPRDARASREPRGARETHEAHEPRDEKDERNPSSTDAPVPFAALLQAMFGAPVAAAPTTSDAQDAAVEGEGGDGDDPAGTAIGQSAQSASAQSPSAQSAAGAAAESLRWSLLAESGTAGAATAGTATGAGGAGDGVAPELRARIGRVIDRMRDEFGHDVDVVETTRTQARQDALFAQGRTTDGPVVTWTRHSQHTLGRAADVRIDGGYGDAAAFRRLQQVAAEEGLRTLGARDPGHLELPRDGAGALGAPGVTIESMSAASGVTRPGGDAGALAAVAEIAAVAEVASAAPVAPVAHVAAVAEVAQPGVAAVGARGGRGASGGAERRDDGAADARRDGEQQQPAAAPAGAAHPAAHHAAPAAPVGAAAAVHGPSATDRVSHVRDLQDAGAARSLSHITLRLDGTETIRVDMRGTSVDAAIAVDDHAMADRLRAGVGELRDALGRHGLTADAVHISAAGRSAADAASPVDAARATAAVAAAAATERSTEGGGAGQSGSGASQQQAQRDQYAAQRDADRDGRESQRERHEAARERADASARDRARRGRQPGR